MDLILLGYPQSYVMNHRRERERDTHTERDLQVVLIILNI